MTPPEEIDADLVLLTRWSLAWADELADAVGASLGELRPFMPWANDGYDTETARRFLIQSAKNWAAGTEFNYAVTTRARSLAGAAGLTTRMGPGILEIGYWTHSAHSGQGFATAVTRALAEVALGLAGVERVVIRHDAANVASARVAAKAGFAEVERRPSTLGQAPGMCGTEVVWERSASPSDRATTASPWRT